MTRQIQMQTCTQHVWACKRDGINKIYALVTESCDYECFLPYRDTLVKEYVFESEETAELFWHVINRIMDYQTHVDGYYKKWWYRLMDPDSKNNKRSKMVQPYIKAFNNNDFTTIDSDYSMNGVLMTRRCEPEKHLGSVLENAEKPVLAYAQKSDDKHRFIYELALPRYLNTEKHYPYATVIITGFTQHDPEYETYKNIVYNSKLNLKNTKYGKFDGYNTDRIQRFNDYFCRKK